MSDLITLRALMGLSSAPTRLSDSSLILVDCQNTYREGLMKLAGVEAAIWRRSAICSLPWCRIKWPCRTDAALHRRRCRVRSGRAVTVGIEDMTVPYFPPLDMADKLKSASERHECIDETIGDASITDR